MHFSSITLALLASSSAVLAAPIPQSKSVCVGSSFSPTNCDSSGADSINVDPSTSIGKRQNTTTVGSSFSPTNANSPGADSVNVDPSVTVDPTIGKREPEAEPEPEPEPQSKNVCVGSSFSPTNCDSPGADSVNVDPAVTLSPTIGKREPEAVAEAQDSTCVGSSFSPTNCNSPGADSINVDPSIDVSPSVNLGGLLGLGGRS